MELKIFNTKEEVAREFSVFLNTALKNQEEYHIALSGGSTPKIVFDELARTYGDQILWENVHFYWGDERCVPPGDEQSNYKMTKDHLLSKINIPEKNVHRIRGEADPAEEATRYSGEIEENLPMTNGLPKFDLVILGMGDDGHTASIFPHQIELWGAEGLCEVATHPDSGQLRITITGKLINNAQKVAFLVTGKNKSEKVKEIINKEGAYPAYPASLVAPESGELIWYLDREAAALLS